MAEPAAQTAVHQTENGAVVCVDSAYDADERNTGTDVVISGSYSGVLPARFVATHRPRAAIGLDCAVGPGGAGIAGLWFYEALGIPAAAADVMTVLLGNGVDVWESGVISYVNELAGQAGVEAGMLVAEAAELLLAHRPEEKAPDEVTNRTVRHSTADGDVVCTDSIAFGLPEDRDRNVLCTAGHTGRSAVPYLRRVRPRAFICSDGGGGRDESGIAGLVIVEADGLAGATVDARTAAMGNGLSTYDDGVISAANTNARAVGVQVGMPAAEAAELLLQAPPVGGREPGEPGEPESNIDEEE
ncbi:hypothetical protein [Euzebya tangerina]|uniref:hypothetical protein n=1 Tax=Euzebya tangerina TaxID=591198 RepID=UPI00196AB380|nr:hypothetical protein [Euzebya tangerina]